MLGVKTYEKTYIDQCAGQLEALLAGYDEVAAAATAFGSSVGDFEGRLATSLVIVLDAFFVHRLRGVEGKDGNPLNEVRMLAESILHNDGVLAANSTIKYRPETSVLGYEIGATIAPNRRQIEELAQRYFEEMERRFT
jgi:hypothetical protein